MEIRFWAVGATSRSLRDILTTHIERSLASHPEDFPIGLRKKRKSGRNPGWSKAYSLSHAPGVVNYDWNERSRILACRAVTKGRNRPLRLIGEFVEVLMSLPGHPVRSIHVECGTSR